MFVVANSDKENIKTSKHLEEHSVAITMHMIKLMFKLVVVSIIKAYNF